MQHALEHERTFGMFRALRHYTHLAISRAVCAFRCAHPPRPSYWRTVCSHGGPSRVAVSACACSKALVNASHGGSRATGALARRKLRLQFPVHPKAFVIRDCLESELRPPAQRPPRPATHTHTHTHNTRVSQKTRHHAHTRKYSAGGRRGWRWVRVESEQQQRAAQQHVRACCC